MPRPHRFLRARLAGWTVALGLGLGSTAAHAASDPSAKLGLQVGTLVNVQCPAPDLPHIVAVRSLGDIADWFNPQAFEAAIADELPDGSEVGQAPTVYFDNTNERQIRDRLAGDYGSLFLVELVPAEQRVDASLSGHCLSGTIEEMDLRVVSASPPEASPGWPPSTANTPREAGDQPQQIRAADRPPLTEEGGTTWTTSVSPPQPARSEPPKPPRTDPATPSNPRPTASSKTLPRLKMRNVGTIQRRVPRCSAALDTYQKAYKSNRGSAIGGAFGGTVSATIVITGAALASPPMLIYGAAVTGLTATLMLATTRSSRSSKRKAKECITNAGYQLGH